MKYLIIGKNGQLGKEFVKVLDQKGKNFTALGHEELDIGNLSNVLEVFESIKPDIVINCAAYNLVDKAEDDYPTAYKTNAVGVRNLAYASSRYKSFLVHYSTDYVFDGKKEDGLYSEKDIPNPLNEYAKSKYLGELFLQEETQKYLLFRVSWVFGEGKQNFIYKVLSWAKNNDYLKIAYDEVSIPTSTSVITDITLKALEKGLSGLFHLTNSGYCSRFELAKFVFDTLNMKKFVYPVSSDIFDLPAKRPKFSAMDNSLISYTLEVSIPHWTESVKDYLKSRESNG